MNIRGFTQPAFHKTLDCFCCSFLMHTWSLSIFFHWGNWFIIWFKSLHFPSWWYKPLKKQEFGSATRNPQWSDVFLRLISLWILSPKSLSLFLALYFTCVLYCSLNLIESVCTFIQKLFPWNWFVWPEREMTFFSVFPFSPPPNSLSTLRPHCQVPTVF